MKTVISSKANHTKAGFDLRFGRAAYFCVYDSETKQAEFIVNSHANAQGGAGTKASEKMIELGVNKVISGDFGPKAKDLLNQFKIQMVIIQDENKSIQDIIDMISSNN